MKKSVINIFRWIGILPIAILGAMILGVIIKYVLDFWQEDIFDWNWLKVVHLYWVQVTQSILFPISFVIIGMKIAPSYKRETGVFLIAIMIIAAAGMLVMSLFLKNLELGAKDYVFYVFHFLGSICSFAFLPKNDLETIM